MTPHLCLGMCGAASTARAAQTRVLLPCCTQVRRQVLFAGPMHAHVDGSVVALQGDAIVNSTNSGLTAAIGGVDAAVHRAAGPGLRAACDALPAQSGVRCHPGEACLTPGFKLLAKHVIHAVGPVYASDGISAPLLASAYRSAPPLAVRLSDIRRSTCCGSVRGAWVCGVRDL